MIAYLKGTLIARSVRECVVLTAGGVGYEAHVPDTTLAALPALGGEVELHTQPVIREDVFELYGFATSDERAVFKVLISVPNLGPKKALAILSLYAPAELAAVVQREDLTALTKVSGIGKKTGQQILWDLKFKLEHFTPEFVAEGAAGSDAQPSGGASRLLRDVLTGLSGLGYTEDEVRPVLERLLRDEPDLDAQGLLRGALSAMAQVGGKR